MTVSMAMTVPVCMRVSMRMIMVMSTRERAIVMAAAAAIMGFAATTEDFGSITDRNKEKWASHVIEWRSRQLLQACYSFKPFLALLSIMSILSFLLLMKLLLFAGGSCLENKHELALLFFAHSR